MKIHSQISHPLIQLVIITSAFVGSWQCVHAQTAPPPTLGEETKGEPALPEQAVSSGASLGKSSAEPTSELDDDEAPKSFADNLLGEATITESRRESGQVYQIELEHSSGSKQVIEQNNADGQLTNDDIGLDDAPNLPKWKLGSW